VIPGLRVLPISWRGVFYYFIVCAYECGWLSKRLFGAEDQLKSKFIIINIREWKNDTIYNKYTSNSRKHSLIYEHKYL